MNLLEEILQTNIKLRAINVNINASPMINISISAAVKINANINAHIASFNLYVKKILVLMRTLTPLLLLIPMLPLFSYS